MNKLKNILGYTIPIFIISWILWLPDGINYTNTYRSTNLVMGLIGLMAFFLDRKTRGTVKKSQNILIIIFSFLFATASLLSGLSDTASEMVIRLIFAFLGAFYSAYSVMHLILTYNKGNFTKAHSLKFKPLAVFLFCFCSISAVYLTVFILGFFPGVLTPDSAFQVYQGVSGDYQSGNPYYHTLLINLFVKIGDLLFGDINIGIGLFHTFQILAMSCIFSFAILTLYQKNAPLWVMISAYLLYIAHPINIIYSFTMWKDIPFAGAVLLLIIAVARIILKIGKTEIFNYILVIISSIGFCVLRNNGMYAFIITVILFLFWFIKEYKALTACLLAALICSGILLGPALKNTPVKGINKMEQLSIPAQQIARVVYDGCELTDEEYEILSNFVDVEKIPETYESYCSNAMKTLIRYSINDYIENNKGKLIKLWIGLGIKYPKQYIAAWVDQTKGYYHSGHYYWMYSFDIVNNDLGIKQASNFPDFKNAVTKYALAFYEPDRFPILNVFVSIGFMFWLMAGAFVIALAKGQKKTAFIFLPVILIIMSLLVATPVYSEFRYAYSLFVAMPLIGIIFCKKRE